MSSDLRVLRPPYIPRYLDSECRALCVMTVYHKGGFEESDKDLAPGRTDCLTAIAFLFRKCKYWNLDWIANMPHKLLTEYGFTLEKGMTKGDVIFFANRRGIPAHVVIALNSLEVFHCSRDKNGGEIVPVQKLLALRGRNLQPLYREITNDLLLIYPNKAKKNILVEEEQKKPPTPIVTRCIFFESSFRGQYGDDSSHGKKK